MLLPSVTLDPAGTTPVWHGAQAGDPCANDTADKWEPYANPYAGTLTPPNLNVWQLSNPFTGVAGPATFPFGADFSKAVIRTNAMQSVGELGYIHRPEPFKYLTLQPGGGVAAGLIPDWAMLDLFTVGNTAIPNVTSGRININSAINPGASGPTTPRLVPLKGLLNSIFTPLPPDVVAGNIYADTRVNADTYGMNEPATLSPIFDTIGEICEATGVADTGLNDAAKEATIRRIANLITVRSNTFNIRVIAQSIKQPPGSTFGTFNPPVDLITGEVRAQAVVERYERLSPGAANSVPRFRTRYFPGICIIETGHVGSSRVTIGSSRVAK